MNIVHLLSQNQLTGAEVYAAQLIESQVTDRHCVYQISNDFFRSTAALQLKLAVETKSQIQFWKNVLWLRQFLKEKNIQVLHTHSRAAAKLAFWARLGLKVGHVSTIHGRQHNSISKRLMNHYGDFQITVCENIKQHLIQDFNYSSRRLRTVRNPISTEKFSFLKEETLPKHLKIAVVGRTTGPKGKRTELILNELPALLGELSITTEYFIVGGRISDLSLPSGLEVIEVRTQELKSLDYQKYDLVVGSGRVALESLVTGIPTLSFGEAAYLGLTTWSRLKSHYESNFGDIGLDPKATPTLSREKLRQDLKEALRLSTLERRQISNTILKDFNHQLTARKVFRIYESSYFLRNYSKWIPVLMYHKIPKTEIASKHKIFVTEENFKKHLQFYKSKGFETLTFSDLKKFKAGLRPFTEFPQRPLVLTFDDGYRDNLENASPLLKSFGFKAQLFLLADQHVSSNNWDASTTEPPHEIIAGVERHSWKSSAFEIGSHGFNHKKITQMTEQEARFELHDSKRDLENEFGTDIPVYAFTYGDTHEQASEWALEEGYDYAVNTDTGGLLLEENPHAIFRVNIFPHETTSSLAKKTSTWYRRYYYWKRKK